MATPADELRRAAEGWQAEAHTALSALTRLGALATPPAPPADPTGLAERAMAWYPAIGVAIGLGAGCVYALGLMVGVPALLAALLALTAIVVVTGAGPEDGLAVCLNGLAGGRESVGADDLASRRGLGTEGVLGLMISFALRTASLAALPDGFTAVAVLIAAATVSRAAMVGAAHWVTPAPFAEEGSAEQPRADPTSDGGVDGVPSFARTAIALVGAALIAWAMLGAVAVPALIAAAAAARLVGATIAERTPSLLGAVQQVAETAVLVVAAVVW